MVLAVHKQKKAEWLKRLVNWFPGVRKYLQSNSKRPYESRRVANKVLYQAVLQLKKEKFSFPRYLHLPAVNIT